jgi:hypothetical protein
MRLPNAENAVVDIAKLRDYCLNPNHPKGKHKARVFLSELGLTATDADRLRKLILDAVLTTEATVEPSISFGQRYVVDFQVQWEVRFVVSFVTIRSAWIIRKDEDFPRLTTCFIPQRRL